MTVDLEMKIPIANQKDYRANSLWRLTLRRIFRQRNAIAGMVILGFLILVAIFAPLIAPYDPTQVLIGVEPVTKREAPCVHLFGCDEAHPQHIMGIDGNVRDVFSRVVYGTRVSLSVGLGAMLFAITIGTLLGAVAGYLGGWVDNIIMRILDVLMAFPSSAAGNHHRDCAWQGAAKCITGNCDCFHSHLCQGGSGKCPLH